MACSENFIYNPNSVNRYCPKIIFYLPLADLSKWHFHVTEFVALSAGKVKYTLTLGLVVIFLACVCHCIGAYFSGASFLLALPLQ